MRVKKAKEKLRGVQVIVLTPFDRTFNLDLDALRRNVRFVIDNGITNGRGVLTVTGACGEGPYLTVEEHKKVWEAAVDEANGKAPVFCGIHENSTKLAVEMVKYAEEVGVLGSLISPPYYKKPSETEVYRHYKTINDAVDIGIRSITTHGPQS